MAQQIFRVNNPAGMWIRTEPVVSEVYEEGFASERPLG